MAQHRATGHSIAAIIGDEGKDGVAGPAQCGDQRRLGRTRKRGAQKAIHGGMVAGAFVADRRRVAQNRLP